MLKTDIAVIGGGPAGMSAAVAAYDTLKNAGHTPDVTIIERGHELGGILRQCIHNGFGLHRFGTELTGPEYNDRDYKEIRARDIKILTDTTVTAISQSRLVTAVGSDCGLVEIQAQAVILATGCRERPRGALNIPGTRPAGIYSAGCAQQLVNIMGLMPGKSVVILGSGDIGLIMARRMTLEGAKVHAVCELMPYSSGLARNIQQCLHDFDIPLRLSTTVVEIHGKDRLEGVTVARVDENRRPIDSTREFIPCDTLLLSVGLIPENEVAKSDGITPDRVTGGASVDEYRRTPTDGIYECGNALHVHDLADYASEEAAIAGKSAARQVLGTLSDAGRTVKLIPDGKIRYTVPQRITGNEPVKVYFRVNNVYKGASIVIKGADGGAIYRRKRPKLAPGEMETVTLTPEMLEKAGNELYFILEENSESGGEAK